MRAPGRTMVATNRGVVRSAAGGSAADVTDASADWRRRLPQWQKIRDALEGEDRVKDGGVTYLPKPRGMKKQDYDNYVGRASFYGVSDRTLRGLVGLVFRVEPVVKVPTTLPSLESALTPEGLSVYEALRESVREVMALGRYVLLVDLAPAPSTNPRPQIATYLAEDCFRVDERVITTPEGTFRMPVRVLLREEPTTANDVTEVRIRELRLDDGVYSQRVYVEIEDEYEGPDALVLNESTITGTFRLAETIVPKRQGKPLDRIPIYFINPFDRRARTDKPPMLDLVNVNLAHYRNSADYEQTLYLASQPTPYIFGVSDENVPTAIGASTIWHSVSKDTRAGMLEFRGEGASAQRQAMMDKEERMAALGARLIADARRDNTSAETTRLETRAESSLLVAVVHSVGESFRQALRFAAEWASSSSEGFELALNTDFVETRMTAADLRELVAGWQSGAYSRKTLHENLQRGEIVPSGRTVEEEVEAITDDAATMVGAGGALPPQLETAIEQVVRRLVGNPGPEPGGAGAGTPSGGAGGAADGGGGG